MRKAATLVALVAMFGAMLGILSGTGSAGQSVSAAQYGGPGNAGGQNGPIVFQSNRAGGTTAELYLQNEDGTGVRRLTFNTAGDRMPRFSPDGRRIAFASDRDDPGNFEIYVMDLATKATSRITNDAARDDVPVFTADGTALVWQRGPFACPCSIWTVPIDGSSAPRQVDTGPGNALFPDMSPHGRTLTYTSDQNGANAIYTQQLNGQARRQVTFPLQGFGDFRSRWSPEDRDLVFMRDDGSNNNDVYTVHQDGTDVRQLTSGPRFEEHAQFSPDGQKVLFSVFANDGSARMHTIRRDASGEVALPRLSAIADSFDGPALDSSMWWEFPNGSGTSLTQTDDRVELSLAADAADGPDGYMGPTFGTVCSVAGDYDIRASYELLDWPEANGTHLILGDAGTTGSIGRRSEGTIEDYLAFFNPVPASAPTADETGMLRLVRTGSTLRAYFATEAGWELLLTGLTTTAPVLLNLHLFSNNAIFANKPVSVAVNDVQVNATGFECPSWWRDSGPDWQAVR